jgi:spore maturation protein CgeB
MNVVVFGLSITSSWGNGHATTFRGLLRALAGRGHDILFLERDQPWYADHRDLPHPPYCRAELYASLADLKSRFSDEVRNADCVIVGSYVPEGVAVCHWATACATGATAFYDIDTPVTLAKLERGEDDYLSREMIGRFDLYLSFTGGRTLELIEKRYGSQRAVAFYCSVDPALYFPETRMVQWDLGYLGTYSEDRQPSVVRLLMEPARQVPASRFIVAGPQYPGSVQWPRNVKRVDHLNPSDHRTFYNRQRFTLNVTRADMIRAGYSPSVRLFEAAACGTPIISDRWNGLDSIFEPGKEILIADDTNDVVEILREMSEIERRAIGNAACRRVLAEHTATHRAAELEALISGTRPVTLRGQMNDADSPSNLQPITL